MFIKFFDICKNNFNCQNLALFVKLENFLLKYEKHMLLFIFSISFILRTLPVNLGYHIWDETVYLSHAEIIAGIRQNYYNEFEIRPPLLSFLLAPFQLSPFPLFLSHILVSFLSSLCVVLVYFVGKELYNKEIGIFSSIVFMFFPYHIQLSHSILVDSILPFFWLTTLYSILKEKPTWIQSAFFVLSVLLKFTSLFLFFVVLPFFRNKKEFFRFCLLSSVLLFPYFLWNFVNYGNPIHSFLSGFFAISIDSQANYYDFLFMAFYTFPFLLLAFPENKKEITPFVFLIILLLIARKEFRLLLPIAPFLLFYTIRNLMKYSFLLPIFLLFVFILFNNYSGFYPVLYTNETNAIMLVGDFLEKNNLSFCTNQRWPELYYYSKQRMALLPVYREINRSDIGFFCGEVDVAVLFSNTSPYWRNADFDYLKKIICYGNICVFNISSIPPKEQ